MATKIGVLTSGGDAPGMNAAVRAVVRAGLNKNIEVVAVYRGYNGLINGDFRSLDPTSVSDIVQRGGTVLYTARCMEFMEMPGVKKAAEKCREAGGDGMVCIGGDGTFRGAADLSSVGIPCIGVPGTIDNDIAMTEYTIGYDTAMNTAMGLIDRLRDTAWSHERCWIVEVMGRHAGYIALNTGIACGATAIITPEMPYNMDDICNRIIKSRKSGKDHFVIVVAEGVGKTDEIAKIVEERVKMETRVTVLGHVQRGGSPTLRDRVEASRMGYYAVELLEQGIGNRVVGLQHGELVDVDIQEALKMKKEFPEHLYRIANEISI